MPPIDHLAPSDPAISLVFDPDLCAPACVLLQAAYRCRDGTSGLALQPFEPNTWLTAPTPGMRVLVGTREQWARAAELSNARWKGKWADEGNGGGTDADA